MGTKGIAGRKVLLEIDNGSGNFVAIGGAQKWSMGFANELADMTNADDDGVRRILENAGVRGMDVSLSGVYLDDDENGQGTIENAAQQGNHITLRIVRPGTDRDCIYQCEFAIEKLTYDGEQNKAMLYSIDLKSSGQWTVE